MAIPTAIFLDTSIFAGQQYNLDSTSFKSFIPVAQKAGLKLLLPDPTEREIKRQIKQRSEEALRALDEARRKAPFLTKWEHYPKKHALAQSWLVDQVAKKEIEDFFQQFNLVRLNYDGVSIVAVMNWYDKVLAPFGDGKKRKEFPDAFAVAILSAYATRTGECIAVVSEDKDFKSACDRYGSLLYFGSLPKLTEVLLADPSKVVELRNIILEDIGDLERYIHDGASELNYYHSNRRYNIDENNIAGVSVNDIRIVGIGDGECTISFDANVETEHRLTWDDWAYSSRQDDYDWAEFDKWVSNDSQLTGIAKLAIDFKAKKVNEIAYVKIDENEIEVSSEP